MARNLLFMALLLPILAQGASKYTMADLTVLAQEGWHGEFLDHALDVRPSERKEEWRAMVSKMADLYTKTLLQKLEMPRKDFEKIQALWSWPSLKGDDVFKARRQELSLNYLKRCLKNATPCWKEMEKYWESDKNDPETAFQLAELISQHKDSPYTLWAFLTVALKSPLSEFYCKRPFAMDALWGKLEVDYIRLGPKGDLLKKIDDTVHPDCLPSLIAEARRRLAAPEKIGDRELAHQVLHAQNKADQGISDFFYTVYLLENPSQGELFNYSWNRIKELGSSSSRREAALSKLKGLDPLPDSILNSFDNTKKRVVLSHFKRYFPEYLGHYVGQCLKFYGGKANFPQGNPTIHCQDLMNSEMAPQLLEADWIKEFQKVKKI